MYWICVVPKHSDSFIDFITEIVFFFYINKFKTKKVMLAHRETERDDSNRAIQITNRLTDSHLHLYTRTAREREEPNREDS